MCWQGASREVDNFNSFQSSDGGSRKRQHGGGFRPLYIWGDNCLQETVQCSHLYPDMCRTSFLLMTFVFRLDSVFVYGLTVSQFGCLELSLWSGKRFSITLSLCSWNHLVHSIKVNALELTLNRQFSDNFFFFLSQISALTVSGKKRAEHEQNVESSLGPTKVHTCENSSTSNRVFKVF